MSNGIHRASRPPLLAGVLALALLSGCAFPSEARRWNDRVGSDGEPVYYMSVSKIGLNLLVFVPFLGNLGIDGLVSDLTEFIQERGGDNVRIVQGSTSNYWYGWSPFTWFVTPVVSTVSAEYRPSAEELQNTAQEAAEGTEEATPWYKPWTW